MAKYTLIYNGRIEDTFDDIDEFEDFIEENGIDDGAFQDGGYLLFKGEPLKVSIKEIITVKIEIEEDSSFVTDKEFENITEEELEKEIDEYNEDVEKSKYQAEIDKELNVLKERFLVGTRVKWKNNGRFAEIVGHIYKNNNFFIEVIFEGKDRNVRWLDQDDLLFVINGEEKKTFVTDEELDKEINEYNEDIEKQKVEIVEEKEHWSCRCKKGNKMNRAIIEPTTFIDRNGEQSHGVRIYDDYDQSYENDWWDMPRDDMEVLKKVVKSPNLIFATILNHVEENKTGLFIGDKWYNFIDIAHIFEEE